MLGMLSLKRRQRALNAAVQNAEALSRSEHQQRQALTRAAKRRTTQVIISALIAGALFAAPKQKQPKTRRLRKMIRTAVNLAPAAELTLKYFVRSQTGCDPEQRASPQPKPAAGEDVASKGQRKRLTQQPPKTGEKL